MAKLEFRKVTRGISKSLYLAVAGICVVAYFFLGDVGKGLAYVYRNRK